MWLWSNCWVFLVWYLSSFLGWGVMGKAQAMTHEWGKAQCAVEMVCLPNITLHTFLMCLCGSDGGGAVSGTLALLSSLTLGLKSCRIDDGGFILRWLTAFMRSSHHLWHDMSVCVGFFCLICCFWTWIDADIKALECASFHCGCCNRTM